jgi:hypothetical protein
MAQRYAAASEIAPVLAWTQFDSAVASDRFQYLDFDQSNLPIDVRSIRICPKCGRVAIALNPDAGQQPRLGEFHHGCSSPRSDVNVEQLAKPEHAKSSHD